MTRFNLIQPVDYFIPKAMVFILIFIVNGCSNSDFILTNRTWDACTTEKGTLDSNCSYFMTYTFNSDGTFIESHKTRDLNNQSSIEKRWVINGDVLSINLNGRENNFKSSANYELHWIDHSTFYTLDKNAHTGVELFIYYRARD